jgi:hypothetical protein
LLLNPHLYLPFLQQVLEALAEIAFVPQFLPMRIEKERKAVLAEAQMMNTIEYRIDCQLLTHLHAENNLGCRWVFGVFAVLLFCIVRLWLSRSSKEQPGLQVGALSLNVCCPVSCDCGCHVLVGSELEC